MSKPQILLLLTIILKSSEWESTCDKTGNCKIIVDNEEIYLRPGYLPFYPVEEVNPINSDGTENINQQNFTLNILTGYPKKGILKGSKKQFECAGGMNECANSCCKEGYCKGTRHDCNNKYEKIEIIFIIVGSVFGIFLILFWIYYFIIGCNYNKIVERDLNDEKKELKENQNYGNFIQKKNSNSQSDSQIDEQISNLSHGTIQEENYNQFNNEKEENKFETIRKRLDNAPKRQINLNEE